MKSHLIAKIVAWGIALTLVALPVVGVLNGWFAGDRWPITRLDVKAQFHHVSAEQIRAVIKPALSKGFFAVRLDQVRDAVAKLSWVEHVEARKHWPDTIDLVIRERHPYARWGENRLIEHNGQVFSVADASDLHELPRLAGPDDRINDVLAFYANCMKRFTGSGMKVDAVTLSPRGSWKLELASGTLIQIGGDAEQERLQRFLDVWPRLATSHATPPVYVDLRYENGFAMRWPDAAPATAPKAGAADPKAPPPANGQRNALDDPPPARALFVHDAREEAPAGSTESVFSNFDNYHLRL
ncbi:MAG: cell division protein FtsQ/DivIB [Rhodanobacter sp.]|jgi:cell division protein FtsQ|nr:cell division protein FtsQ/DivIB [Rhodanobacter sp.]